MIELPKGIHKITNLPDPALGKLWDSIIIDDAAKRRLLNQAILNFTLRTKVDRSVIPLHGVILLTGVPGTGKTSLAKGLSHRIAESFNSTDFRLLEVEPHSLASAAHGKTQRAVTDLFSQVISEAADTGPTVVLLDEVETLAADRAKLSLEANPIDVHRATDAVLVQLDYLAEKHPNLLFVATSNFPKAVDEAFLSRCDLIMEIPLPAPAAREKILRECLKGLAGQFPAIRNLLLDTTGIESCARECAELDGRAIRKMVANALALDTQTSMDPELLEMRDLVSAAKTASSLRKKG